MYMCCVFHVCISLYAGVIRYYYKQSVQHAYLRSFSLKTFLYTCVCACVCVSISGDIPWSISVLCCPISILFAVIMLYCARGLSFPTKALTCEDTSFVCTRGQCANFCILMFYLCASFAFCVILYV